jgi:hypothetical protein
MSLLCKPLMARAVLLSEAASFRVYVAPGVAEPVTHRASVTRAPTPDPSSTLLFYHRLRREMPGKLCIFMKMMMFI